VGSVVGVAVGASVGAIDRHTQHVPHSVLLSVWAKSPAP
jgi:hypothetical protein